MFDEKDTSRHVHRGARNDPDKTVVVDSSAFFAPETAQPTPPPPAKKPPKKSSAPAPQPPRRSSGNDYKPPKRGSVLLIVQAILSVAAFIQLCRTQMLPTLYLVIIAALLVLFWLLVKRCQEYKAPGTVSRVFSVFLCAMLAVGCVWAQQGLAALDNVTSGLISGAEANKITKEPFVLYLSGVDNRGELTEKARSDVNILAVVNPTTKRVALINTPRDYYVDLAGTDSKDKLTHAGLYGVETSMATLGNLYGIQVDHYIRIDFSGFISIIDAVGGVDVYSDQAFTSVGSPGYYDPTTFAEGWNHLDGKSALAFARERHAFASGDIQRGINQMKVIDAMANKLKSPTVLMSFSKLMDAVSNCFVTSLSQEQISALVRMQLGDLANWDIESCSVTGSSGKSSQCYSAKGQSLYVMKPDESSVSKAKELIASVLGGEGTVSDTQQTPEKTDVHTPTADPNAAVSVPETPADSVIVEEPAESIPEEEVPADEPPAETTPEPPADGEQSASTEAPAEEAPAESDSGDGSTEAPSISLPTQEQVEQAASSLHQAASTVLDALFGSSSGQ
ncbi:LCP family protein [Faecalibacterium hattorii]|jgi:LCP family protein required for cell wall assembly|uniref:Transcriptional regulator n=1 Tax=Faecalibacterium hattorii TaxID=2935520 RepID=A0A329UM04_9FIRM|nr:LCP family protein [Faecalibacterium hattorii]RAW62625.1 transcriptional regulator [Faecalibacterium hattorii]